MTESAARDAASRRLERALAEGRSREEVLADAPEEETAELLRLLALHELAEDGLEDLAEHRVPALLAVSGAGRRVGGYRLLRELGQGGMGVVHLARDEALGRLVALKLLSRTGEDRARRFRREAEILASLEHPNVVPIYARGEVDGLSWIAMRYVAGPDCARALEEAAVAERLDAPERCRRAATWCLKMAEALHAAHERGVLHRDVKPGNVLVEDGEPFVLDFGLAVHAGESSLTRQGDLVGTVPYMAPEQVRGENEDLDRRVDVYGVGATLYELLAGHPPFAADDVQQAARQVLRRDPPSLRRRGVAPDLEAVVMKALEKERDRRYATARELAEDLGRFLGGETVRARRLGPLRRGGRFLLRHRAATAALAAVLLALVVAAASLVTSRSDRRAAAEAAYAGALGAAERGDALGALATLDALLDEHPDHAAARALRRRCRLVARHDRLMGRLFVLREDGAGAVFAGGGLAFEAGLEDPGPDEFEEGLVDRFRVAEIVWLRREGRDEAALAGLSRWERDRGGGDRRTEALRLFVERGEGLDGREMARRLEEIPAETPDDAYFAALVLALVEGGESRALAEIESYLRRRPADRWARHVKGNVLRRLGRHERAFEVYDGLVGSRVDLPRGDGLRRDDPLLDAALYQRGLMLSHLGRYGEALADFEAARGGVRAWAIDHARGHALRGLGRGEESVAAFRRALEGAGTEAPTAARGLARILVELGRHEEAARVLESETEGAERELGLLGIELARARALRDGGDAAGSRRVIDGVLARLATRRAGGDEAAFAVLEAEARAALGDLEGARTRLDAVLERDPRHTEALVVRARLRFDELLDLKRSLFDRRLPPEATAELRDAWSELLERMAEDERRLADDLGVLAEGGLQRAAEFADPRALRLMLGISRHWRGEDRAAAEILGALETRCSDWAGPRRGLLRMFLGRALDAAGRRREALAAHRRALEDVPEHSRALSYAGRLAARLGDLDALEEILALMKTRGPRRPDLPPGWSFVDPELRAPDYEGLRDHPRVLPHRAPSAGAAGG